MWKCSYFHNPIFNIHNPRVVLLFFWNYCCCTVVFLKFDFTKGLSGHWSQSFRTLFQPHFFQTVLNPILVVFAMSLDVFFAGCMLMIRGSDNSRFNYLVDPLLQYTWIDLTREAKECDSSIVGTHPYLQNDEYLYICVCFVVATS